MTTMKDLVARFGEYGEGDARDPHYVEDDPRGGPIAMHLWSQAKQAAFTAQGFDFPDDAAKYLDWEDQYDAANHPTHNVTDYGCKRCNP